MITAANNDQGVTYIQVRKERVVVMIAEMIEEQLHTLLVAILYHRHPQACGYHRPYSAGYTSTVQRSVAHIFAPVSASRWS